MSFFFNKKWLIWDWLIHNPLNQLGTLGRISSPFEYVTNTAWVNLTQVVMHRNGQFNKKMYSEEVSVYVFILKFN